MANIAQSTQFSSCPGIFRIFLTKSSSVALFVIIGIISAGFLSSCNSEPPASGPPVFANQDAADAHASEMHAESPDYDQYSDLVIPPLPPQEALETFELEEGFRIELVAHEPEVVDPVAMDVDAQGRLWVVEMTSYMPVHHLEEEETSELERVPQSRIVVLEDTTGDGRMDHSWVFMDKLILPRAINVLDDGVLLAEPPNVWFIQDTTGDGIGDSRKIVDSSYGDPDSDNVEHMANGLMWGMDNWIHSVYTDQSLRRVNGQWETRPFERITQWGITQDDWGRIYSSHNSRMLTSHLAPYGYSERHPEFDIDEGMSSSISESETVWPAHATGVNRGYRVNSVVRENGTLKRSTATCGTLVYRGDQFGEEYYSNVFVAEPAGNLIKRLTGINEDPGMIEATARFAYEGREFLTSTDERFRPVNLYNAPDGSIYVLDMYRGIFQHARYLTGHLRDYAVEHDLHLPAGKSRFGRIYRIVREDREIDYSVRKLNEKEPVDLANLLTHKNGMLRDEAQQLLVQRSPAGAVSTLEDFVGDRSAEFYTRLQALWTLEGYDDNRYGAERLSAVARAALEDPHPRVRAAAIRILEPEIRENSEEILPRLQKLALEETELYPKLQLLASLGESNDSTALKLMAGILNEHTGNEYFREMALNGIGQQEAELLRILHYDFNWREGEDDDQDRIIERLGKMAGEVPRQEVELTGEALRLFKLGEQQYGTCSACHGTRGQGIEGVAPPLDGSEWVRGEPEPLTRILLHGFEGGAGEQGIDVAGVMPAHGFMSDEEIAAVLTYIRQSWGNEAPPVTPEEVTSVRETAEEHQGEWSPEELRNLPE